MERCPLCTHGKGCDAVAALDQAGELDDKHRALAEIKAAIVSLTTGFRRNCDIRETVLPHARDMFGEISSKP